MFSLLLTNLFLTACLGPNLEQAADHGLRESGIFLEELDDAVGELRVVQGQTLHLVQGDQHLH